MESRDLNRLIEALNQISGMLWWIALWMMGIMVFTCSK